MQTAEGNDQVTIVWFRQDLRLADHPALLAAIGSGRPVVPLFVLDDESPGPWRMGGASRWWLHHSLVSLQASLKALGATLILRRGAADDVLPRVLAETGAAEVHAGRMHEPWARLLEGRLEKTLPPGTLRLHRTSTLFDLEPIRTKTGGIYGVYTPFARGLRLRGDPPPPQPAPARIDAAPTIPSDDLADWALLPTQPDWAAGFRRTWQPGEGPAHARMASFVAQHVKAYGTGRNIPGQPGTSMLSAHLHWGELSPGQVWHAAISEPHARGEGLDTYLNELLWREFAAYLLWHNPHLPEHPLRPRFAALPTRTDPAGWRAWCDGQTGIPIVDAGMRQLWALGWMHNRVRMIVASFLVKHQLMRWQDGEAWFWDTLVDADLASNAASWQWVAGCGIDSQPFFRVFNPVSQGEKFDSDGAYVRAWVPELKNVPDKFIHAPWTAPAMVLAGAGVTLGKTYPKPVLDLAEGRLRALAAYRDTVRDSSADEAAA